MRPVAFETELDSPEKFDPERYFYLADREEPVEKLLGEMQSNRVDQAVLVQIGGASLQHHAYLCHGLEEYPGRFRGSSKILGTAVWSR